MTRQFANPYTATDSGLGVTESSLTTWRQTRGLFGRFVEVRLGPVHESQGSAYATDDGRVVTPTMVLVDESGRALALNGVTCGFQGTGPSGAALILAEEGFLCCEDAASVVTRSSHIAIRLP